MSKETRKYLISFTCAAAGMLIWVLCKLIVSWVVPPAYPEYYTFWDAGDTVWTIAFAVGGFLFGRFYSVILLSNKELSTFNSLGSYDISDKSLHIEVKSPAFKSFVAVAPVLLLDHTYNEPTLVYTGATVGGISMGGFHMEGGDYNAHVSRSGKFRLVHIHPISDTRTPIEKIVLPPHLVVEAKKDIVLQKFLEKDTLRLFYNVALDETMSELTKFAAASGDAAVALSAAQRAHIDKHLTKEDCNYIRDWLLCR